MATFQVHEDLENIAPQQARIFQNKTSKVQLKQQNNRDKQNNQQTREILNDITNAHRGTKRGRVDSNDHDHLHQKKYPNSPLSLDRLKLTNKAVAKNSEEECEEEKCTFDRITPKEYAFDIWKYLYKKEAEMKWPKCNYMVKQKYLNEDMRCVLVDWLISVAEAYKMGEHTIHLSVNYLDRFLSEMSVVRDKFQLLGAAAMMLAVKVEEVNLLDASECAYLCGKTYTVRQVTRMEQLVLNVLKFEMNVPTMVTFVEHFCVMHQFDKKTLYTAMYICELILLEGGRYLQYLPSMLAVASVVLARYVLHKKNPWFKILESSSGYSFTELKPVIAKQYETFRDSPSKEQQAIQNKYKTEKYYKVANVFPRALFLEECDNNYN